MRVEVDYNQPPQRPLSFWEQWQIMEIFSQYPALTLKVLLHRRIGLRRAEPMHVGLMAALLILSALPIHNWPLGLFGVAVAVAGIWQHVRRWKELRGQKAEPWHTFSDGVSPLEDWVVWRMEAHEKAARDGTAPKAGGLPAAAPLPPGASAKQQAKAAAAAMAEQIQSPGGLAAIAGESRIYRLVEPIAIAVIGFALSIIGILTSMAVFSFSGVVDRTTGIFSTLAQQEQSFALSLNLTPLGTYLIFAATCLWTSENLKWRHQIRAYLDWYDSQIDGAATREWGGRKAGRRVQPASSRRQTYGLPTGIGNDIRASVERQARAVQQRSEEAEPKRTTEPQQQVARPAATVLDAPDNRLPIAAPEPPPPPSRPAEETAG